MVKILKVLKKKYFFLKPGIKTRLAEFEQTWQKGTEARIFEELIFCLMTPQSRAKLCWEAVRRIRVNESLKKNRLSSIVKCMKGVRFRNTKAGYIRRAREFFLEKDRLNIRDKLDQALRYGVMEARDWLVKNVKGFGYKEASHFLRNIGFGKDIAILDRHILKNMVRYSVIKEIPKSLHRKKYIELEEKLKKFATKTKIPLSHIDLLFWAAETGEIFK
ncbi:MAG: N-glycosylase/DNA lyase [Elusimicrobiota bacterium]